MLEIKENRELNVANLLSYRGKVKQAELENAGKEMADYIQNAGTKRVGNPITVGYNVTKKMDMLNPENTEIDVYVGISPNIL